MEFSDLLKEFVLHGFARRDAVGLVIAEHLVEQIEALFRDQVLVLIVNEFRPVLLRSPKLSVSFLLSKQLVVVRV